MIRLIQTPAEVVTDRKRAAFALAVPAHLLKGRSIIELPGPKAAVRIQQAQPSFYVQSTAGLGTKLELVQLKVVKESRVVEKVEVSRAGTEKASNVPAAVELQRKQLTPGLYSLKLLHPLDPGEYALGDLAQQGLNIELWPFGLFEIPTRQEKRRPPRDSEQE